MKLAINMIALTETYVIFITENDVLKAGTSNLSC